MRSIKSRRASCSSGEDAARLCGVARASRTAAASATRLLVDILKLFPFKIGESDLLSSQLLKEEGEISRT
jgi:hypothetical protein